MKISDRLKAVPASPIRKLVPLADAAKKSGVKVYHFNIGDPDVKTPEVMLQKLKNIPNNPIGYAPSQGHPVFLTALQTYYHNLGHKYLETKNIQVTTGGSEAIAWAMFSVADPGEEILVFEPFYANYNSYAKVNGIRLVPILTMIENGFHLPPKEVIEQAITSKTKAILYTSPNNPTGTVYTKSEIEMLVEITQKHNLFLLSDEVYREFCFDGLRHTSLFNYMQKIPQQSIVLDSLSKRYSICGARLGALVSLNDELMKGVGRIGQGRLSAGLVDQLMAAELTKLKDSFFTEIQAEYQIRRDTIYEGLRKIDGVVISKPEGAFYCITGLPVKNAEHFCQWLLTDFRLKNETVMLAPAAGFYATPGKGRNEVRIAYVLKVEDLERCLVILKAALEKYPNKSA